MVYRYIRSITIMGVVLGVIFISLAFHPAFAAPDLQDAGYAGRLDEFLRSQMEAYKIPGLAVAIVRSGDVEYQNGYGVANTAGDPVTPDTPFLLASVSKSFTATALMQLVSVGKIDLDAPVQRYLPWFETDSGDSGSILVSHLLYHTSGFSELGGNKMNMRPNSPNGLEEGVRALVNEKLNFTPGNGWEYSNINYNVLGLLVQEVSGQSYETYIHDSIFKPLGMNHSFASLADARKGNAASGYLQFFGIPLVFDRSMPYTSAVLPSAGLWSSASDLGRYMIANLEEGMYKATTLLPAEDVERLHTPGYEIGPGYGYAMGWFRAASFLDPEFIKTLNTDLNRYDKVEVLWHEGDWANYKSIVLLLPGQDYGITILMNTNDATIASAFKNFAWDATLIATGGEAFYFPPQEDFIVRNSRWIFSSLNALLLLGLAWSIARLKKAGKSHGSAWLPWIYLLVNTAILLYLHLVLLPDNKANIYILLKSNPDLGLLALLTTLLTATWGVICLLMIFRARNTVISRVT